jgi:hypothetical protein
MQKRILLDGCSFTYGLNLHKEQTLAQHFIESGYEVINQSRPGKSNQAIALDLYNYIHNYDIAVVGWTFSSRWYLKYHTQDIDLLATRMQIELPYTFNSESIEQSYQELHRSLYSLYDSAYWNQLSDQLVDSSAAWIKQHNKKIVFFSWESRSVSCAVYYPHVMAAHRLPCGHLNPNGTRKLYNELTSIIES